MQLRFFPKTPTSHHSGLHRERASADTALSGPARGHAQPGKFLQKIRDAIYRARRLRWGFGRLTLYGIWREVGSLVWRIETLRGNTWYRKNICLPHDDQCQTNEPREHRIEEFFRRRDIQWLLAKYPRASALDIHLFALGWGRRRLRSDKILEELEKARQSTHGILGQ
jgi:hypothetical protein